jgi:hypothetical protein
VIKKKVPGGTKKSRSFGDDWLQKCIYVFSGRNNIAYDFEADNMLPDIK